jgi:6-phospho-3-hexuloisomerase
MPTSRLGPLVLEELANVLLLEARDLDWEMMERFVDSLDQARRVLLFGAGRSGSTSLAFAQRLNHVSLNAAVVGEAGNRRVDGSDVVVVVSGSGATPSAVTVAKEAKRASCQLVAITSTPQSPIGELADLIVRVHGRSKGEPGRATLSPYTAQFDLTVLALSEVVGAMLLERRRMTEPDIESWRPNVE